MLKYNDNLYGNYRNVKFTDIYPDVDTFTTSQKALPIPNDLSNDNMSLIYYLLYSNYANNTIAPNDTYRFELGIANRIFQYAPTFLKKLELQKTLRDLTLADIKAGSRIIYNHSYNPSTEPSTSTLTELTTIDMQNTTNYAKSDAEAIALQYSLLQDNLVSDFLRKFQKLFIQFVEPEVPLWYISENN